MNVYYFENETRYIPLHILRNFNDICCSANIQYVSSFLDDRSDSSFVLSLTHIPKEQASRHFHLSSSDMTLQDPWHHLFLFSKRYFWEKKSQ